MTEQIGYRVRLSGPFFAHEPGPQFQANVIEMMNEVAAEGQSIVRGKLRQGESGRAPIQMLGDRVSDHAIGRTKNLAGKQWIATAVVSVNNSGFTPAEGKSLMAAASSVEGRIHAFRATVTALNQISAVRGADLAKGLA